MTDRAPEFETVDSKGTVDTFSGTVGTSLIAVPTVAGNVIQSFTVICDPVQSITNVLTVYLDGVGTVPAAVLYPGGFYSGEIKGSKRQINLKANVAGVSYQVTLDREES